MNLFELLDPKMFRLLSGRNQAIYADLLMLVWERCSTSQDYGIEKGILADAAEEYVAALPAPPPPDEDDETAEAARSPRNQALLYLRRLRETGWLEEQEAGYEEEIRVAVSAPAVHLLRAFDAMLHPKTVTYSGKLFKAYRLLEGIGEEKSPYENVLKEVSSDMAELNDSLRQLNSSIGTYIDRLTRNKPPQEVLDLFQQYEEQIVVAAYHRFKTSDNLFSHRAEILEGLDRCEGQYFDALREDYCRVEQVGEAEGAAGVQGLVQSVRDDLDRMHDLLGEIDRSHVTYRQRAVQRAQFMLLSDGSTQGKISDLLRYYAETVQESEELLRVDESPLSRQWRLYPAAVPGRQFLKPAVTSRRPTPIEQPPPEDPIPPEELERQQKLLMEYVRQAVTQENVNRFAQKVLRGRETVSASALVEEDGGALIKVIGLHTYSRSEDRNYELTAGDEWVRCGGVRFQQFWVRKRG